MRRSSGIHYIVLTGVLAAQCITHMALLSISADSGLIAVPWLMNRGMVLFENLIEHRAPARFYVAAFALRVSPLDAVTTSKLLNLVLVLLISLIVWRLSTRLAGGNRSAGLIALLVWALWEPVYGNVLFYFDTLVGIFVLLGLAAWVWSEGMRPSWLAPLVAGILLSVATFFKQQGIAPLVVFGLAIGLLPLRPRTRWRDVLVYALTVIAVQGLWLSAFALRDTLSEYLYWIWTFNLTTARPISGLFNGAFLRKLLLTCAFVPPFILQAWRNRQWRPIWVLVFLLWLASVPMQFPLAGEIHVMAQLPLLAIMVGLLADPVTQMWRGVAPRSWLSSAPPAETLSAGLALSVVIGWIITVPAPYVPGPLGIGSVPAYDEFSPLAPVVRALARPEDTLFILPETDNTPQLHEISGLMPPNTWISTYPWLLRSPGIVEGLLAEWRTAPPTYIIDFPQLATPIGPDLEPLIHFMQAHYSIVGRVDGIAFSGDALIYRLSSAN